LNTIPTEEHIATTKRKWRISALNMTRQLSAFAFFDSPVLHFSKFDDDEERQPAQDFLVSGRFEITLHVSMQ